MDRVVTLTLRLCFSLLFAAAVGDAVGEPRAGRV